MNKILFWVSMGWVLMLQTGCWQPFAALVATPTFKKWSKPGISELEIKKAMLECGYFDPYDNGIYDISAEDFVLAERCMKKSGFIHSVPDHQNLCGNYYRDPACDLPESQVPDRSVDRRVNSKYCQNMLKNSPDSSLCTKNQRTFYEHWEKQGVESLEIEKALLECGDGEYGYDRTMVHKCMEDDGFRRKDGWSPCRDEKFYDERSCTYYPERSVARRLNSEHCKANSSTDACMR